MAGLHKQTELVMETQGQIFMKFVKTKKKISFTEKSDIRAQLHEKMLQEANPLSNHHMIVIMEKQDCGGGIYIKKVKMWCDAHKTTFEFGGLKFNCYFDSNKLNNTGPS